VAQVEPGYLGKFLPSEAPVDGELFQTISDDFQKLIHPGSSLTTIRLYCQIVTIIWALPGITHWSHSSFFAYFPAACSFEGIFADLLSSSVSNPGFNVSRRFLFANTMILALICDSGAVGMFSSLHRARSNCHGLGG
jgi:aromatic-L-amino-acid decarboxylase